MSKYHQATRLATGEMSDVDPDEWPIHKKVADALGGELRPFDQYQGPYIAWEGRQIFIGPPENMWSALVLGEGWVHGIDDSEEALRQVREALDARGVEQDASDFVSPDEVENYLMATDTRSGVSTNAYPNTNDVADNLVDAIKNLAGPSATPETLETP